MSSSKRSFVRVRSFTKKMGVSLLAAGVAVTMCVPATAFAINGSPTSSNFYGMNPSAAVGTNTTPSSASGDTLYDLESAHNTRVVAACGGNGTAIQDYMDVLGADGIGTSGYNWGTKINTSPNWFSWNDFLYTDESDATCSQVRGDATSSSLGIGFVKSGPYGVCTYSTVSKYRPQVLANNDVSTYQTIVSAIHSADGNSSYNPQYAVLDTSGLCTLVDSMWNGSAAIKATNGYGTTVTARYGDPDEIAQDFENFIKATQWYILSQHEQQNTMKTVAYVTSYSDGTAIVAAPDPTEETTSAGRQYEGFEQISHNVAFSYNSKGVLQRDSSGAAALASGFQSTDYTTTDRGQTRTATGIGTSDIRNFLNCDVVFTSLTGDDFTALSNALTDAGFTGKIVQPSLAVGNQGFGFARNLMEYMGYLYPDDFKLSYGLYYFWNHFAHVKADYVDAVMVDQDSSKLLPTGDADTDLNTNGYTETYMKKIFGAGQKYYQAHKSDSSSYASDYRLKAEGTSTDYASNNKYDATDCLSYVTTTAKSQTIKVKTKKLTIKAGKSKKISASAKTSLSYAKKSGNKKITVSKAGKVKVKKSLKKGSYKIKVKVTAKKTSAYKKATKTATITVKVTK